VLLFLGIFFLQYAETFAAGQQYYRSVQLRGMNDDRWPFNRPLLYHEWLSNHSRSLSAGTLPLRRVVLVVVDGLRYDTVSTNAALRQWLSESNDTWVTEMRCALPTMSAPNWLTLLSGARPEITGLHGNIFPGETEFSTLMSTMSRIDSSDADWMWGMTGCLWWSDMVKSHFPRMSGDGTVSSYSMYDVLRKQQALPIDLHLSVSEQLVRPRYLDFQEFSTYDGQTDDATDRYRTEVACQALTNHTEPFRFFLLHLTNVDTQAHYYGVHSKYNVDDSYDKAVTASVGYIRSIVQAINAQPEIETTLVVTADHGEVDAGGHGGVDPVLRRIPLMVYNRGSGIRHFAPASHSLPDIDDVAPSITALLDLPAPRQSTGHILPVVWQLTPAAQRQKSLRDLVEARQELLNLFALQGGYTAREWCRDLAPLLQRNQTWMRTATPDELEAALERLTRLYAHLRNDMLLPLMTRNLVVSAMLAAVLVFYMVVLMRRHTLLTHSPKWDARTAALALGLTVLYLALVLGAMGIYYAPRGYPLWDSTWVHSVPAFGTFLLVALVPGTVVAFVLVRAFHLPYLDWDSLEPLADRATTGDACCRGTWLAIGNTMRIVLVETAFAQGCVTESMTMVYFLRLYWFAWSVLLWSILLVLQGTYTFFLPFVYSNFILNDETWALRFRIAAAQLACFPMLLGTWWGIVWFSAENATQLDWRSLGA